MQASGLIRFEQLNALGVQILREAERSHPRGINFTFGPALDEVLLLWDPSADLDMVYHLAGLVSIRDHSPGRTIFPPPAI